jgi:hypothetical protein
MKIVAAIVLAGLTSFISYGGASADPLVLAQAGSTGGVIGKQDKSISGGVPATPPGGEARKRPAVSATRERSAPKRGDAGPKCSDVAGTWDWFNGDVHAFSAGGTMRGPGVTGNWTCSNVTFVLTWSNGFVDRLTLSSDGSHFHLSGRNQYGLPVNGTRR